MLGVVLSLWLLALLRRLRRLMPAPAKARGGGEILEERA
jgi:hypothetical protein